MLWSYSGAEVDELERNLHLFTGSAVDTHQLCTSINLCIYLNIIQTHPNEPQQRRSCSFFPNNQRLHTFLHVAADLKQECPTHIANPNTANHISVRCGTEGDGKCGGTLQLKISGRIEMEGWKAASLKQERALRVLSAGGEQNETTQRPSCKKTPSVNLNLQARKTMSR